MDDPYPRSFIYRAEIYHDLVWGTYRNSKEQKGAVSGRGAFLLEISKDRKSMEGFIPGWIKTLKESNLPSMSGKEFCPNNSLQRTSR
jgi:hypothetical protein